MPEGKRRLSKRELESRRRRRAEEMRDSTLSEFMGGSGEIKPVRVQLPEPANSDELRALYGVAEIPKTRPSMGKRRRGGM